jgi:hypothetical protein
MSAKEQVIEAIQHLPDHVSLQDISEKVSFILAVEEGLKAADEGRTYSLEEVKALIPKWAGK